MILGHGVDMVSIARVAAVVKAHPHRSQQRIFTPAEWAYAHTHAHPSRALAKRWAAKEAVAKALGTGLRGGVTLRSIDVVNNAAGQPAIELHNGAAEQLHALLPAGTIPFIHLSLCDEGDLASASVIISALPTHQP
ncbi:MAG: holo-[acyl-carrier-protein] synthase [Alphaproteobacteria bacterium]|nr:holo-[acyl-carrier-protein] synthase [Alphaproteobacteria bacterium]